VDDNNSKGRYSKMRRMKTLLDFTCTCFRISSSNSLSDVQIQMFTCSRCVSSLLLSLLIIGFLSGCLGLHPTQSSHIVRKVGISSYVPSVEQTPAIEKVRVRAVDIRAPKSGHKLHSNFVRNQVAQAYARPVITRHSVDYVVSDGLKEVLEQATDAFFVIDRDSEYTVVATLPVAMKISWRKGNFFCGRPMVFDAFVGISFLVKSETSIHKKITGFATKREEFCGRGFTKQFWPLEDEIGPIFQSAYQEAFDKTVLKFSNPN